MSGIVSAHTELEFRVKSLECTQFREQRRLARQGQLYRPRRIFPASYVFLAIKCAVLFQIFYIAIDGRTLP